MDMIIANVTVADLHGKIVNAALNHALKMI